MDTQPTQHPQDLNVTQTPSTEKTTPYERLAERHIRLLEILHEIDSNAICCRLTTHPLQSDVRYVAVSYTWGRPDPDCYIQLNEENFSVRKNLLRFWQEVREWPKYRKTLFWIDALCIDQDNSRERSEQVKLMADIYQRADHVLVWLGPAYANSDLDMKALARDVKYWSRQMKMERVFWKPEGAGILHLCERSYWTRLWVLQELVHAKTAVLMCGSKSISWKAFVEFGELAQACPPVRRGESFEHVAFKRSPALSMVRQVQQTTGNRSALFDLILASHLLACSEPRDKVYALLGVARAGQHFISPDYSVSILQLVNSVLRGHHFTRPPKTMKEVSQQCRDLSQIMGVDITRLDDSGKGNKPSNLDVPRKVQPRIPLLAPGSNVSLWWIDHYDHVMVREIWLSSHTQKDMDAMLFAAITTGEVAAIRMLLNLGSYNNIPARLNLNCGGDAGERPFVEAARLGRAEIVKLLLEHDKGDLIAQVDGDGCNAMYHAVVNGNEHVVKQLITHPGVNINGKCAPNIPTPILHLAIQDNHPPIVRLLLSQPETNPNITYSYGTTKPLKQAIYQHSVPLVKLLLARSADLSHTDTTPLHLAIAIGDTDITTYLLSSALISPNARDHHGRPTLFTAMANWRVNLAALLLAHPSIEINAADREGNTALHMAVRHQEEHIQDLFLAREDIDFNARNAKGRTALWDAVEYENERMQEAILRSGRVDLSKVDGVVVRGLGERAYGVFCEEAARQGVGTVFGRAMRWVPGVGR